MISTTDKPQSHDPARRRFLAGAGATMALSATYSNGARASTPNLKAMVFPIDQSTSGPYPEQTNPLYSASSGKWGVAFSGGGSRAFSAALGQMRGLTAANVLGKVGAISCVSGGTWFGAPYTFASASISDTELLGPLVQPGELTVDSLEAESQFPRLAALMSRLKDDYIQTYLESILPRVKNKTLPSDKIYSRMLNLALLQPYNLSNTNTQFTLDQASLEAIRARNPGLTTPFYLARQDRPFFIAGGTQIMPLETPSVPAQQVDATTQVFHSIEYTPLYVGAPQLSPYIPPTYDYGGGYVESFAFNTTASQLVNNIATVPVSTFPFILSDVVGSSSSAPEAMFEAHFHTSSGGFPQFDYWPVFPSSSTPVSVTTNQYSFGDGGTLEDTGVVALLRRGYQTIFAFVNSNFRLGSTKSGTYGGIAEEVSQLFGYPEGNPQSTQVFSQSKFLPLVQGLMTAAQTTGGPAVYADTYPVMSPNYFGISPYSPRIFWIYNGLDENWYNKLKSPVADLLTKYKYEHSLQNFPFYETVLQNLGELVYLTPLQVHLLADMWAYSVSKGFEVPGSAFGLPIG